jgi:hypothetical protein
LFVRYFGSFSVGAPGITEILGLCLPGVTTPCQLSQGGRTGGKKLPWNRMLKYSGKPLGIARPGGPSGLPCPPWILVAALVLARLGEEHAGACGR